MKPRHAAAWGALVGLLIPIAITVAVGVDDSLWVIWKLFIFLWPGLYFVIGMAVYAMLAWLAARILRYPIRPRPA